MPSGSPIGPPLECWVCTRMIMLVRVRSFGSHGIDATLDRMHNALNPFFTKCPRLRMMRRACTAR